MVSEMSNAVQEPFEAEPDVEPFPFILDSAPIGPVARHLNHLGITKDHKTFEVALEIAKLHKAFKPSQF